MCEVLDKSKLEPKEKNKLLQKLASPFTKKEVSFTAELAWLESTYGDGTYRPLEKRILDKQDYIKNTIRSKFAPSPQQTTINYCAYHCVIDIEDDLRKYTEEVFKPFVEGGFDIINLSEECKNISEEGVYLISWKNVFKK